MAKNSGNHLVDAKDIQLPMRQRGSHKSEDVERFEESLKKEREKRFGKGGKYAKSLSNLR